MIMTLRWFGKNFDSVTLKQIRQIPGVKGVITTLYDSKVGEAWKEELPYHSDPGTEPADPQDVRSSGLSGGKPETGPGAEY